LNLITRNPTFVIENSKASILDIEMIFR